MMRRRDFLRMGFTGLAAASMPWTRTLAQSGHGETHGAPSPLLTPFMDALPIPPVLKPVVKGKVDTYALTMKPGVTRCHSQLPMTSILGYNGWYPGPVIRARKGRMVRITQTNELPGAHHGHLPTVHLHGALVAPEHDGHPEDIIPSGGSRVYEYPNKQRACALWFHDHTHEATGENVYRGLAGLYFLDDPLERGLRLPRGAYEIPLVIQDRCFDSAGQLVYQTDEATLTSGFLGDVILVNGKALPYLQVATRKYRFRILNGSNSRIYKLALTNGAPLVLIGTDGGLLQRPRAMDSIEIAPSERVDVIVDFANVGVGTSVVLSNLNGTGRTSSIMRFDVSRKERDNAVIPTFLTPWEEIPESSSVKTRDFILNRQMVNGVATWVINGQAYAAGNPVLANPKLGTIEKWRFLNPTTHPHPMHVHLVQFQVIDIGGQPQEPSDHGWKDTVVVPPGSEVTIISKFEGYTGRYVMHCHNLEHEDFAMMGEFEVVP